LEHALNASRVRRWSSSDCKTPNAAACSASDSLGHVSRNCVCTKCVDEVFCTDVEPNVVVFLCRLYVLLSVCVTEKQDIFLLEMKQCEQAFQEFADAVIVVQQ